MHKHGDMMTCVVIHVKAHEPNLTTARKIYHTNLKVEAQEIGLGIKLHRFVVLMISI